MSVYLGSLGRLVELPYVTSQSVAFADRYSFSQTLGGRTVGQVLPGQVKRTWSLSATRYLAQAQGTLMSFVVGEWGNGPFVWVSSDAQVLNMLTPAAASCDPKEFIPTSGSTVTPVGPMLTPDGWAGRSFAKDTNNGMFLGLDLLPVLGGKRVTVSAYVRGAGGAVRLFWYNAAGSNIGSVTSAVTAGASSVVRSFVTGMPPSGTVGFRVGTNSAVTQATRPAATWTDTLFAWGDGQGCLKAVVSSAGKDVQSAHYAAGGHRAANMDFTVTEVG